MALFTGIFGSGDKTTTSQSTTNNVANQQTGAADQGVALGSNSNGNSVAYSTTVNNVSSDLDVVHSSLDAASNISGQALSTAQTLGWVGQAYGKEVAETGLAVAQNLTGAAIASNTNIAGASTALASDAISKGVALSGAGLALANNAIAGANATTATLAGIQAASNLDSLHAVTGVTHDAIGLASGAIGTNAALANNLAGAAIAGNLDALHSSLNAVTQNNAIADSLLQGTIGQFTGALEGTTHTALQVAANAAPQTDQALLERLAQNQGVTGAAAAKAAGKFDWTTIGTIALIIAVAYYFVKTAK